MDLHKKGVFNMAGKESQFFVIFYLQLICVNLILFLYPVSDISEPTETFNGEVNSEEFWETLSMERIATGLLRSKLQQDN